jgi:hypothetical protein
MKQEKRKIGDNIIYNKYNGSPIEDAAKLYIANNMVPIPLNKSGDGKGTFITDWQTTHFDESDFNEDNNIGINIGLSNPKLIDGDMDSREAAFYALLFLKPTVQLGLRHEADPLLVTHHFYNAEGSNVKEYVKRKFPNGKTIAELRVEGNTVVEPSIAESKLFKNKKVKREWVKVGVTKSVVDENLSENFNKVCVASVLKTVIASDNMPIVKLTSCLKRYCTTWSEADIYSFIEILIKGIKNYSGGKLFSWKVIKPKIKTVLNNYNNKDSSHQAGYLAFSKEVGMEADYARAMFQWIGDVPKEGSEKDKKTIVSFRNEAMTENDFLKEMERSYLVEDLICDVGLYVLAGKPKQGKSRLIKDLAYKVVNGGNWLGHPVAEKGDVLLLALEDNEFSMNLDIKQMGLQNAKKPTTFVGQCPSLERGLIESIEMWCKESDNPKLIIIDTFQKIKPMGSQKTKNANAYEVDYHYLSQLHEAAKNLKVCIIYIHHLSQADKSHSWDKIMGSTGHQGVTDAMYMLDKEEGGFNGTFKGLGRNIAGFEINICWNSNPKEPMTFQYTGDTYEAKTQEHKREIFKAMKQLAEEGADEVKPVDVYKVLNLLSIKEKGACKKNMQRMRNKGDLAAGDKYGTYKLSSDLKNYDSDGNYLGYVEAPRIDGGIIKSSINYEADKVN